jgi:hypothetical protein
LDFEVNDLFVNDGLLAVPHFRVVGTTVTYRMAVLTKGNVKLINYSGQSCVGVYAAAPNSITLNANGTAVVNANGAVTNCYYRVVNDDIFLYSNSVLGTRTINDILNEMEVQ